MELPIPRPKAEEIHPAVPCRTEPRYVVAERTRKSAGVSFGLKWPAHHADEGPTAYAARTARCVERHESRAAVRPAKNSACRVGLGYGGTKRRTNPVQGRRTARRANHRFGGYASNNHAAPSGYRDSDVRTRESIRLPSITNS
jgi:hypothetical protein